jgi:hypothetical protein
MTVAAPLDQARVMGAPDDPCRSTGSHVRRHGPARVGPWLKIRADTGGVTK